MEQVPAGLLLLLRSGHLVRASAPRVLGKAFIDTGHSRSRSDRLPALCRGSGSADRGLAHRAVQRASARLDAARPCLKAAARHSPAAQVRSTSAAANLRRRLRAGGCTAACGPAPVSPAHVLPACDACVRIAGIYSQTLTRGLLAQPLHPAGASSALDDAAVAAYMRAHSMGASEMLRKAGRVQRETLSPQVQHEYGLDRPSINASAGMRRNSSAPTLSREDDGLPKVVIGICGECSKGCRWWLLLPWGWKRRSLALHGAP